MGEQNVTDYRNNRDDEIYQLVSFLTKVRAAKDVLRVVWPEEGLGSNLLKTIMFSLTKLDEILSDKYEELYERGSDE